MLTAEGLAEVGVPKGRAMVYARELVRTMEAYGIDTVLRQAHFLGQVLHESGMLRYTEEIWGPTKAQLRYEGRKDLGNVKPGDGSRFRGRGLIQLTGRFNYRRYTSWIQQHRELADVDFVAEPWLVGVAPWSVDVAGWFWMRNHLNTLADLDDVLLVTRRINGGYNGLADRRKLTAKAKTVLARLEVEQEAKAERIEAEKASPTIADLVGLRPKPPVYTEPDLEQAGHIHFETVSPQKAAVRPPEL